MKFISKTRWFYIIFLIIMISASETKVTVYSIGDSTMSSYDNTKDLRHGWMQNMPQFFNKEVEFVNAAKSGRSSKSFINEGWWKGVITKVKPGDYVIIQFGHNDEKADTARHTDPWTTYTANLKMFVTKTRQKGGFPILCTSIIRRHFNPDGTLKKTHGEYPDALRKVASELKVPLVDMNKKTAALVQSMGPDSSKALFNYVQKGESKLYPDGNKDDSHLNDAGATKVAALFVDGLRELKSPLVKYLLPENKK